MKHLTIFSSLPVQVYMIHNIKNPILSGDRHKILVGLRNIDKLPEPTTENTWHPNTINLLNLRDWFFGQWYIMLICLIPPVKRTLKRIIKFVIILYDFDPPWRWILDSVREEILKQSSLKYIKKWILSCVKLDSHRMKLIKRIFDIAIIFSVSGGRYIFKPFMRKALGMDWKPRGFEDTWTYKWWHEDSANTQLHAE